MRALRGRGLGSSAEEGRAGGAGGSVLVELGGRRLAAGLTWLVPRDATRTRRRWTFRQARELGATWYAERERQTGFWVGEEPDAVEGAVRSLAHEVVESIESMGQGSWQVLLQCADERYAIVRGHGREVLPTGDVVVEGRDEALGLFGAAGDWGAVYATPGLVPDARVVRVVVSQKGVALHPVPFGRAAVRRRLALGMGVAGIAGALVVGGYKAWEMYGDTTREVVETIRVVKVQETIKEGVDPGKFLTECEEVLAAAPALPPMWQRVSLECRTDASDFREVAGSFTDGVLFARWQLKGGANGAVGRTTVESRIGRWDVGSVLIEQAWAGIGVAVAQKRWEGQQPSLLEFRRAVDERLGTVGALSYAQREDGFGVTLRTAYPLEVVRARIEGIRWLGMRSAKREQGQWVVVLVRVDPVVVEREIKESAS